MAEFGALTPQIRVAPPGPVAERWVDRLAETECPALTQRRARRTERSGAPQDPIVWTRALLANVEDVDGNVYVDLSAGFGAASVGHTHPKVSAAIAAQSGKLLHALGDLQPADVKVELLSRLCGMFEAQPMRALLGLSGSDAIEAALKTALLCTGRPGLVAFEGAYHGLAHGALAACGYSRAFREPFAAQLNPHVEFAPYPRNEAELSASLAAVSSALAAGSGAVLVEPILGRGGVIVPPREFLPGLAARCQRYGALLIVDEIMTGLGRTGRRFAYEASGITPDLLCLGKALGGGMPVSACIGRAEVMQAWAHDGSEALHTGTFFGHPVSAAAALATLAVLEQEQLTERAAISGKHLFEALQGLRSRHACIREVRGQGLLLGVELSSGELSLRCMRALLERGYIVVPAGADASVISLTPPLCITEAQLAGFVAAFDECLGALS